MKKHKKLIFLFSIFTTISLVRVLIPLNLHIYAKVDSKNEWIHSSAKFSEEDILLARKSLKLIKLVDPDQSYEGFENIDLYWMESKKFAGLTVYLESDFPTILIDSSLKIHDQNNPFEYLKFGAIYSHELSHALNYTKDPDTELITDLKIWNILKTNQCKLNQIKNWKMN